MVCECLIFELQSKSIEAPVVASLFAGNCWTAMYRAAQLSSSVSICNDMTFSTCPITNPTKVFAYMYVWDVTCL